MENPKFDYVSVNATLTNGIASIQSDVQIPDGEILAIGTVADRTIDEMINLSILDNNNEVLRPCDVRFSGQTAGNDWINSFRPVTGIPAGKTLQAKLTALKTARASSITIQVLFIYRKPLS
jgi:hypothetical protein